MKTTSNLQYVGSFSTLQTEGTKAYVDYGTKLSPRQQELYERLMKGLKLYTPEELYAMNSTKKMRISRAHTKAQTLLNLWKQEKLIEMTNPILSLFKTVELPNDTDSGFLCTLPFHDLGITKKDIIVKFMEAKLLPSNYDEL